METKLPKHLSRYLDLYIDCKQKTKKRHDLQRNQDSSKLTEDEKFIRFILENSSPKQIDNTKETIMTACKVFCPGLWCSNAGCRFFSISRAYNCAADRKPLRCSVFYSSIKPDNKTKQ